MQVRNSDDVNDRLKKTTLCSLKVSIMSDAMILVCNVRGMAVVQIPNDSRLADLRAGVAKTCDVRCLRASRQWHVDTMSRLFRIDTRVEMGLHWWGKHVLFVVAFVRMQVNAWYDQLCAAVVVMSTDDQHQCLCRETLDQRQCDRRLVLVPA